MGLAFAGTGWGFVATSQGFSDRSLQKKKKNLIRCQYSCTYIHIPLWWWVRSSLYYRTAATIFFGSVRSSFTTFSKTSMVWRRLLSIISFITKRQKKYNKRQLTRPTALQLIGGERIKLYPLPSTMSNKSWWSRRGKNHANGSFGIDGWARFTKTAENLERCETRQVDWDEWYMVDLNDNGRLWSERMRGDRQFFQDWISVETTLKPIEWVYHDGLSLKRFGKRSSSFGSLTAKSSQISH